MDIAQSELDGNWGAEKAAQKLVFAAKLKEGRDDTTVGLVVLQNTPCPA